MQRMQLSLADLSVTEVRHTYIRLAKLALQMAALLFAWHTYISLLKLAVTLASAPELQGLLR